MRVIMTCGGTGGHIYPAVAIADEIKRREPDAEVLFVGSELGLERTLVPESGYEIQLIEADGFDRNNLLRNIVVLRTLRRGAKKSRKIIKAFKPDVVIGTGGYASVPTMKEAQRMHIPTYIHEQNAVAGKANKLFEKGVEKLFLGFKEASKDFRFPEKHVLAGNPVRREFIEADRDKARAELGLAPSDFTVVAFGGSQGAGRVNKAMMKVIETFNGVSDFRIYLATGGYYYDAINQELADKGIALADNVVIMEYIHEMAKYLAASDLVVSRSGALTVAEVTVCGKPAIFIPSPAVTGNHQYFNAKAVADKGGAIIVEEKDLDNDHLSDEILKLKNNPEAMKKMAEGSLSCAPFDAAKIICDNIMGPEKER